MNQEQINHLVKITGKTEGEVRKVIAEVESKMGQSPWRSAVGMSDKVIVKVVRGKSNEQT